MTIEPISMGYNYSALMSDPYFLSALNSYNPNFRAAQESQTVQNQAVEQSAGSLTTNNEQTPSTSNVNFQGAESTSNTALIAGGATALAIATGAILLAKKGNGEGLIKGIKKLFGVKQTKPMTAFTLTTNDGSIVTVQGSNVVGISEAQKKVFTKVREIDSALTSKGMNRPSPVTGKKITEGVTVSKYSLKHNNNTFTIENGKITEIMTKDHKIINNKAEIENWIEKNKGMKNEVDQRIISIEKGKINKPEDFCAIRYEYKKDGITYSKSVNGKKTAERLTITMPPKKLNKTEIKAYLHRNSEVETTVNELIKNGRAKGINRGSYVYTADNGAKLFINDKGEIEKIVIIERKLFGAKKKDIIVKKGTTEFDAYLHDHKDIEEAFKKEYEAGLAADGIDTNFIQAA